MGVFKIRFLFILMLTAFSVYCAIFSFEYFPFSNYPMYSKIKSKPILRMYFIYGKMQDDKDWKMISRTRGYFAPFVSQYMSQLFKKFNKHDKPRWRKAARAFWSWYEYRRKSGFHQGPEFDEIMVAKTVFEMRPDLSNIMTPKIIRPVVVLTKDEL